MALYTTILVAVTIWLAYTALSRLCLSPLSKFPGPRLAAISNAYQIYFDVLKEGGGKFPWELKRLHEKYGPIVRISPTELHVSDVDFYDVLFVGGAQKRDKGALMVRGLGAPGSILGTEPHHLHRLRRSALNRFFSSQAISNIEPMIRSKIDGLCDSLVLRCGNGKPVHLDGAMLALSTDVIMEYAFGSSFNFLSKPGFASRWGRLNKFVFRSSLAFRHIPLLLAVLKSIPMWAMEILNPKMTQLTKGQFNVEAKIRQIKAQQKSDETTKPRKRTIFHDLIESDLPESEKTTARLSEEALAVIGAGSSTTAHLLTVAIFFILSDPMVLSKLKEELSEAIPDKSEIPPSHTLQRLPYLSAVIKEGSRLTDGASGRLQRIAPDSDLEFRGWKIPAGTCVSMSAFIQHNDPSIWPDPQNFDPSRWLGANAGVLDRYLVNFSKGSRGCIGINLAKTEVYMALATLIRRFELELFETSRKDVDMAHDYFAPYPVAESKGVQILVKACVKW